MQLASLVVVEASQCRWWGMRVEIVNALRFYGIIPMGKFMRIDV